MLVKREVVALKIESTYNTDAIPGANDVMLVESVEVSYDPVNMAERGPIKPTFGKEPGVFAGALLKISFTAELKGSGAAGTAPEIGQAIRACGVSETIVASTSVTYAGASSALESATIYYYQDGRLQILTGCVGTVEFAAGVGNIGKATFTFTGHDGGDSDVALLSGNYDATVPPPVINGSFSVGGFAAVISALNFSLNNEIATPPNLNAADGYGQIRIVDRDVTGSFDPEYTLKATQDWVNDYKTGASKNITTGVIGTTAGNRYSITLPTTYYKEIPQGDRSGIRTLSVSFGATGDDAAFSLAFT